MHGNEGCGTGREKSQQAKLTERAQGVGVGGLYMYDIMLRVSVVLDTYSRTERVLSATRSTPTLSNTHLPPLLLPSSQSLMRVARFSLGSPTTTTLLRHPALRSIVHA